MTEPMPAAAELEQLLDSYQPRGAEERADVARIRGIARDGEPWDQRQPIHVTGSALIVHPETRRVLLRWHPRQQAWIHVGGHADPGDTDVLAVARREGLEETGLEDLTPWPDHRDPIHIVVVPVPATTTKPAHEHADIRFILSTDRPEDARPETDDAPLRWLSFDDAHQLTSEDNVGETLQRVAQAIGLPRS